MVEDALPYRPDKDFSDDSAGATRTTIVKAASKLGCRI
jgi:hypothetical protein